jgi:hypothetical protein
MMVAVRAGAALAVVGASFLGARPAAATVPVSIPQIAPQLPTVQVVVPVPADPAKDVDVAVGAGGVRVNEQPNVDVNVPLSVAPELPQPAPNPPVASDPTSPPAATIPASGAPSAAVSTSTARGAATAPSRAATSVDATGVAGALRPVPRDAWSTIGVAATTLGPWIALFLLALVLRTAALSLLRDRLRGNRAAG